MHCRISSPGLHLLYPFLFCCKGNNQQTCNIFTLASILVFLLQNCIKISGILLSLSFFFSVHLSVSYDYLCHHPDFFTASHHLILQEGQAHLRYSPFQRHSNLNCLLLQLGIWCLLVLVVIDVSSFCHFHTEVFGRVATDIRNQSQRVPGALRRSYLLIMAQ